MHIADSVKSDFKIKTQTVCRICRQIIHDQIAHSTGAVMSDLFQSLSHVQAENAHLNYNSNTLHSKWQSAEAYIKSSSRLSTLLCLVQNESADLPAFSSSLAF